MLNIAIDNLIIEGMDMTRHERRLLQEAVEATLRDLLAQPGAVGTISSLSSAGRIQGEAIHQRSQETGPASLGSQIATSVYHGLAKQ
jgi:hypothetical protein